MPDTATSIWTALGINIALETYGITLEMREIQWQIFLTKGLGFPMTTVKEAWESDS